MRSGRKGAREGHRLLGWQAGTPRASCPLRGEVDHELQHGRLNKGIYLSFVLKCQQSHSKWIFFFKGVNPQRQRLTKQEQNNSDTGKQTDRGKWLLRGKHLQSKPGVRKAWCGLMYTKDPREK